MNKIFVFVMFLVLSGCSGSNVTIYKNESPKFEIEKFFNGDLIAHGIVQDRSREVISRFTVNMKGSWIDGVGTLDEDFFYANGDKSKRIWTLNKISENNYTGAASDVDDLAKGVISGNAFYFEYILNLPVGDSVYKVKFEDWMYLLSEDTLVARSYMSKWGFSLGEVTIVMKKVKK